MAQERVMVMVDPGSTHEGNLDTMRRMIHVAAECGADVVKFQWTSSRERLCERRHAQEYLEAYRRIAWPAEWHAALRSACEEAGIEYACTVCLAEDIAVIAPFVKRFKVASFEASDVVLLRAFIATGKPIIVSTGMAETFVLPIGAKALHCVSAYPAPMNELNLGCIREDEFDGFSDHSGNVLTGALAVAAGARIIETHFRLDDCNPQNPDFPHSLTPAQLREYVANIRFAEQAMGDGIKRCQPSEEAMRKYRVGEK